MKSVIFIILFATSGYAQTHNSKMYDEVQKMFDTGTALTAESIRGVYSGRCFQKFVDDEQKIWYSAPEQAIFKAIPYAGEDAGPAFPDLQRNTIVLGVMPMQPNIIFDNLRAEDFDLKLSFPGRVISPTTSDGKTLYWTSDYEEGTETIEFSARRQTDYIVFIVNFTRYERKVVAPNEAKYACYFFKKLK